MGKKAKKNEVGKPVAASQAKKQKFIQKTTTKIQTKAVNDAVTKGL